MDGLAISLSTGTGEVRTERAGPVAPLQELTAGLARGDDRSWEQFHRQFGPGIFRRLLAATRGDHHLAEEALQQAYLRVARHARACDSEAMFGAWLRVVARTALLDCWRKRKRFWEMLRAKREESAGKNDDGANEEALAVSLDRALVAVSAEDRSLLERKYFDGASIRVLAGELQVSEKAVESRLTRARAELRRAMVEVLKQNG